MPANVRQWERGSRLRHAQSLMRRNDRPRGSETAGLGIAGQYDHAGLRSREDLPTVPNPAQLRWRLGHQKTRHGDRRWIGVGWSRSSSLLQFDVTPIRCRALGENRTTSKNIRFTLYFNQYFVFFCRKSKAILAALVGSSQGIAPPRLPR